MNRWAGEVLIIDNCCQALVSASTNELLSEARKSSREAVACHASYIEHCTGTNNKGRAVRVCVYMWKKVVPL